MPVHRRRGGVRRRLGARPLARREARDAGPAGRLHRPVGRGGVQRRPHARRPDHRRSVGPRHDVPGRGGSADGGSRPTHAAPRAGPHRTQVPAPGERRPAPAPACGDGDVVRSGPARVRRTDHGDRRDHSGRGAGRIQGRDPAVGRRRALRHPRSGGSRPDGGPRHRALRRRDHGAGRHRPDPPRAAARVHEAAHGGGASTAAREQPRGRPGVRPTAAGPVPSGHQRGVRRRQGREARRADPLRCRRRDPPRAGGRGHR